ncbi:MAG: UbiA family prenyltransferase [Anaerolineae bacterium]|nr:UbiA family prenyltransferase [Anaerolineae bacterium]
MPILSFQRTLRGLLRLTRWREFVSFVVPLTLLGALLAAQANAILLDWRLPAIIVANILAVAYAFMINDIEDAPDDARDPNRAARNPVANGEIGRGLGYAACRTVALCTLTLYATGGLFVFLIGVLTLLLSHLYSWRPVRLKAWPVTDIVSHSLMLSGLLMLAGYFLYDAQPGIVWLVAIAATLLSVYGQLYNQLRDLDMDRAAGLHNTAIMLGAVNTQRFMYLAAGLAGACLLAAFVREVFPLWLGLALLVSIAISMLFRPATDMRGSQALDPSGAAQVQTLISVNLTTGMWLGQVLLVQFFPV